MLSGGETVVARALATALGKVVKDARRSRELEKIEETARTTVSVQLSATIIEELNADQLGSLARYLNSPDFDEVALHVTLARLLPPDRRAETITEIRAEIIGGLRHFVPLEAGHRTGVADVILDALSVAATEQAIQPSGYAVDAISAGGLAQLTTLAARKGELLARAADLNSFYNYARQLRQQVVSLHGELRLPHLGSRRTVPYSQLYVDIPLQRSGEEDVAPSLDALMAESGRLVVLGNPGAGKSTMATKLAYDLASAQDGPCPYLIVLRNHKTELGSGGRTLLDYLRSCSSDPYNVPPPADSVEYLVSTGRAIVILDGLDELVESDLRRRVVTLIEGFVTAYPMASVLVTARSVGYEEAAFNARLFSHVQVLDLDQARVERYVRHWFALDEQTPHPQQQAFASAFLQESSAVPDLRRNPLLLSLLCGMYSSEGYIPQNMVEAYEQCALLLFRHWDRLRGIRESLEFHARIRGAIQFLAFEQLGGASSFGSDTAMSRRRMISSLATYLTAKHFDHDEALKTAEEFLTFCTGRAWILSDVGWAHGQPTYGFTHRTFLEYFAAEYIVRSRHSLSELHAVLNDQISAGHFNVVGHIVLQLFDRTVEDGADQILRLLLEEIPRGDPKDVKFVAFACHSLAHVMLSPPTIRLIVEAAIRTDADPRCRISRATTTDSAQNETLESAIKSIIHDCMPANARHVRQAISTVLKHFDTAHGLPAYITREVPFLDAPEEKDLSL